MNKNPNFLPHPLYAAIATAHCHFVSFSVKDMKIPVFFGARARGQ